MSLTITERRARRGRVLVVTDGSGRELGTYDVAAGREDVLDSRDLPSFKAAIAAHLAGATDATRAVAEPTASNAADLSVRVPGHSVMEALFAVQDQYGGRTTLQRMLGISPVAAEARPWFWGALGEIRVGKELTKLGPGWHVLHAVPMGKGDRDVDHVVVGPPGVFTINTKNHSGQRVWIAGRKFMVAGKLYPHIPRAEDEASRAAERLSRRAARSIPVTAAIAVVAPKEAVVKEQPRTVMITTDRSLVKKLRKRPSAWSPEFVDHVAACAADPSAWHDAPRPSTDGIALTRRFEALRRDARSAQRVRFAWFAGLVTSSVAVLPHVLTALLTSG